MASRVALILAAMALAVPATASATRPHGKPGRYNGRTAQRHANSTKHYGFTFVVSRGKVIRLAFTSVNRCRDGSLLLVRQINFPAMKVGSKGGFSFRGFSTRISGRLRGGHARGVFNDVTSGCRSGTVSFSATLGARAG